MNYLSVCSGIEAATVAFKDLGWKPVGFSEIARFPSAVLAYHYPEIKNYGDMRGYESWDIKERVDLICGGTPCQAFSVAGNRNSLDDERGNLTLTFTKLCDYFDPEVILWENVPAVLNTKDNAFGQFVATLTGIDKPVQKNHIYPRAGILCGPKRTVGWRVLDSQYFGVAQRRKRVYVIAYRGTNNWRVLPSLFDYTPFSGNYPETRKEKKAETKTFSKTIYNEDGSKEVYFTESRVSGTLLARNPKRSYEIIVSGAYLAKVSVNNNQTTESIRLLTPVEYERLMGFPDNYTRVLDSKNEEDYYSARYTALGNSWAVPVIRYLGKKINEVKLMEKKMKILNLTQHNATPEQIKAGVVDLNERDRETWSKAITFNELPTASDIEKAVFLACDLCLENDAIAAMIGGAPFLMSPLVDELKRIGVQPVFAFSKRESKEVVKEDGTVEKVSVFRHEGFVEA